MKVKTMTGRSMKIDLSNAKRKRVELRTCADRGCKVQDPDEIIPTFYSYHHANVEGWVFTNDIKYKEPGSIGPAAVCPECWNKMLKELKNVTRKWISTTIKRIHLDPILSGEKTIEYKVASPFWEKRLKKHMGYHGRESNIGINFLCGRESVKYKVFMLTRMHDKKPMDVDGVLVNTWYEIHLGERIS